jgi:hypothetical protein
MRSNDLTSEVPQLDLPADLLAEIGRRGGARAGDFRVDAWSPSFLQRVKQLLGWG